MTLYITRNGQQLGPYSLEQTQQFVAAGNLVLTDLAWYEGLATWIPLAQVPGFEAQTQAMPTTYQQVAPRFVDPNARRERPVMVWVICILYFIGTVLGLIGLAMILLATHLPNLPEAQRNYFDSLGSLYYVMQVIGIIGNLVSAILLFMLRRQALYLFSGMFGYEILQFLLQAIKPTWITMANPIEIVSIVIGWIIKIAVLWYVWHLARTKVLR